MTVRVECADCFANRPANMREEKSVGSLVAKACDGCGAICGPGSARVMHRPSEGAYARNGATCGKRVIEGDDSWTCVLSPDHEGTCAPKGCGVSIQRKGEEFHRAGAPLKLTGADRGRVIEGTVETGADWPRLHCAITRGDGSFLPPAELDQVLTAMRAGILDVTVQVPCSDGNMLQTRGELHAVDLEPLPEERDTYKTFDPKGRA